MSTTGRKLTTIFSADVEGYSRLMGADEEGTFSALKTSREAMVRHIEAFGGRVVNTWGDGLLADFPSVVSAVRAAIEAQGELAEREAGKPPGQRMFYRVGINLGDVIVDGDDLYGDGVNIAARLQAEAPPGGILISNGVHEQVRNRLAVGFEFLGRLQVKNIDESVPAFSVRLGGADPKQPAAAHGAEPLPASRPEFGRNAAPAARHDQQAAPASESRPRTSGGGRRYVRHSLAILAIAGAATLVINLISWSGVFWAKWPLLAFALAAGLSWASGLAKGWRFYATLAVIALFVTGINLLSWQSEFWARWPLLAFALVGALRFAMRGVRLP